MNRKLRINILLPPRGWGVLNRSAYHQSYWREMDESWPRTGGTGKDGPPRRLKAWILDMVACHLCRER